MLTQKYAENEFAAYCQIVKILNSKSSLAFSGDFDIQEEQVRGSSESNHLTLFVKGLERVRIVNLREINASENESFGEMMLGRGREYFPIKVADCTVFKDHLPSLIPEQDRPTPAQVE